MVYRRLDKVVVNNGLVLVYNCVLFRNLDVKISVKWKTFLPPQVHTLNFGRYADMVTDGKVLYNVLFGFDNKCIRIVRNLYSSNDIVFDKTIR